MTNSETDFEEPLACALDADALASRKLAIRERLLAHALSTHEVAGGVELRFEATPAMRDTLEEFIALENLCCSFLQFEIPETAPGDDLILVVTGPAGAQAMIRTPTLG